MQTGALCARCGEALHSGSATGESLCRICRAAAPPFEQAVAHGAYTEGLRVLLHLLKYDGMEPVAARLGGLIADRVLAIEGLPQDLVIVPVPLWASKRRQRGFNQAELLANGAVMAMRRLRPEMRIKLVSGALNRQRATESQAGLSPHQRRANVRGAFFVSRPAPVYGKDVLLVDDIYTTGATARACAQALKRAGAARIWVATAARAQWENALAGAAAAAEIPMEQDVALWDAGQ